MHHLYTHPGGIDSPTYLPVQTASFYNFTEQLIFKSNAKSISVINDVDLDRHFSVGNIKFTFVPGLLTSAGSFKTAYIWHACKSYNDADLLNLQDSSHKVNAPLKR